MVEVRARDVRPQAQSALANSPVFELRDLRVEQRNGALLLCGVVSSYYHKQLAQEVVRAVCRDLELDLVNTIRVR
jgi:osmotically-inducible protein OsmY